MQDIDNRFAQTNAQLSELANKGTTVEVLERVTKEEVERQIADGTLANLMIEDNSITEDKIKNGTITIKSLAPDIFDVDPKVLSINATMKQMGKFRHMVQIKTNGERTRKAYIKLLARVNSGVINSNTGIGVSLYANATDDLSSSGYGIIHSGLISKKSITKLGEYVEYECEYIIPDDIGPADYPYFIFCITFDGTTNDTVYNMDLMLSDLKLNDKHYDIHKHVPYQYDYTQISVTGDIAFNNPVLRASTVLDCIKNDVVLAKNFRDNFREAMDTYLSKGLPRVKYSGTTTDNSGLFVVLKFNLRQIIDTHVGYISSNPLTVSFKASELVNTTAMGTQLFNNNAEELSSLLGGQRISPPVNQNLVDGECHYSRVFTGLQEYQYFRVCINAKWNTSNVLQSGILSELSIKLGDIDLAPYLEEVDGLPQNSGGHTIELIPEADTLATVSYVDNQITMINDRIDNLNVSSDGSVVGTSSKWKNKKWCAVGDSITEKNFRANKNYHDYIKEEIGCVVENRGISGSGYQASNAIMGRVNTFASDSDLITVFAGTNDYNHGTVPLGEVGDTTEETLCGCIYLTFTRLLERFPTQTIAVFTTLPRSNCYPLKEVTNNRGYTLGDVARVTKEIAELFGFPVLDLYHASNLHPWITKNNTIYFAYQNDGVSNGDGLHPNDKGQKVIADKIKHFINAL